MNIPVSKYRKWVNERNEPSNRKQIAYAALDAYEKLESRETIERDDLEPIVIAARSPYKIAWDIGAVFLIRLATKNMTAQNAIREIVFNARKVNERFQIVACLVRGLPHEFCIEILRKALHDKGNRVREKAAEAADRLELKELLPDLDERLQSEVHPKVRWSIKFHASMLRDRYFLECKKDGQPTLVVRTKDGWTMPSITKEDIDKGKLRDIIEKARLK